jgi:hypothetical protein
VSAVSDDRSCAAHPLTRSRARAGTRRACARARSATDKLNKYSAADCAFEQTITLPPGGDHEIVFEVADVGGSAARKRISPSSCSSYAPSVTRQCR